MSATETGDARAAHRLVWTLQDAHEQVAREWPGRHAATETFRAYHTRAASLYEQVAVTDPDHHHEALHWAQQQREIAQEPSARSHESAPSGGST